MIDNEWLLIGRYGVAIDLSLSGALVLLSSSLSDTCAFSFDVDVAAAATDCFCSLANLLRSRFCICLIVGSIEELDDNAKQGICSDDNDEDTGDILCHCPLPDTFVVASCMIDIDGKVVSRIFSIVAAVIGSTDDSSVLIAFVDDVAIVFVAVAVVVVVVFEGKDNEDDGDMVVVVFEFVGVKIEDDDDDDDEFVIDLLILLFEFKFDNNCDDSGGGIGGE
ncbi:hypothetical protein DERP_006098 [Dermatophagoides pteronyssinus]|uniref:Uncharacterized protein n=1 Tax=Dermatophagoides pteronyssinus TaxID=6956 RepID=A0ABQ8JST0_DERPT|nr:hypothetical protein DERP_006098 [Dermatophagoides pteronyssinus]